MHEVGSGLATLDVEGHRADVRLNRPEKRNAMTVALMDDLDAALREADDDEDVRAVALLGGDRCSAPGWTST